MSNCIPGVNWNRCKDKYRVHINSIHLDYYTDFFEACCRRKSEEIKREFNMPKKVRRMDSWKPYEKGYIKMLVISEDVGHKEISDRLNDVNRSAGVRGYRSYDAIKEQLAKMKVTGYRRQSLANRRLAIGEYALTHSRKKTAKDFNCSLGLVHKAKTEVLNAINRK